MALAVVTGPTLASGHDERTREARDVTTGLLVMIIGTAIGAVLGWVVIDNLPVGMAAGFAISVVYLLVASWMDRRPDQA